jgi:hypothetical protein
VLVECKKVMIYIRVFRTHKPTLCPASWPLCLRDKLHQKKLKARNEVYKRN